MQAHVVGPREWTPYAKARYLHKLSEEKLLTYGQIAEYCGMSSKDIERQIAAFRMVEEIYRPSLKDPNSDFREDRFSGFVEFQDNKVQTAIYDAGFGNKDFCKWLHKDKIYPLQDVRAMPKILANPEAKKVFLNKNSKEALKILNSPEAEDILKEMDLTQLLGLIETKIYRMGYDDIKNLDDPTALIEVLDSTSEIINSFRKDIQKIAM